MTRTRALIWAVLALLVGGLAYVLAVGSTLGQQAEASVLEASDFTTNPPAPLSLVSPVTVIGALLVLATVALWVHGIGRALSILIASAVALVGSQLLKESWLERPDLLEFASQNTFPSGHMTVFTVFSAGLIWAVPRGGRGLVSLLAAALLGIVSWQLLEFGWHRPSDVLGAQALAVFAFAVLAWIGPRGSKRSESRAAMVPAGVNRILGIILTIAGVVVVLGGFVLVAVAAWLRSDPLMLNAWEVVLVGASALTARVLARVCP